MLSQGERKTERERERDKEREIKRERERDKERTNNLNLCKVAYITQIHHTCKPSR